MHRQVPVRGPHSPFPSLILDLCDGEPALYAFTDTDNRGMQDCFRKYPEHYASELADDEDPDLSPEQEPAPQQPVEDTSDMPKEGAPAPKSDPAPEASNPSTLKHPEKSVEDAVDELAQSQEQLPPKPQKARDPMRDAS